MKKTKAERPARFLDVEIWITPKEKFFTFAHGYSVWRYPHFNINNYNDQKFLTKKDPKVV
jgi:hypothetical protein